MAASAPEPLLSGYIHTKWMPKDGLPGSAVRNLVQTPDGYLWMMTSSGLARFDGVHFTSFADVPGVPPVFGRGLCGAADGTLWAGLDQGGVVELHNGSAIFHKPGNGLVPGTVRELLCAHDHSVWVVTSEGASRYIDGTWRTYRIPKPGGYSAYGMLIAEDRDHTIAIATVTGVVLKRSNDLEFASDPALGGFGYVVFADPNGSLWANTMQYMGSAPGGVPASRSMNRIFLRDRRGGVWFTRWGTPGIHLTRDPIDFLSMDTSERMTSTEGLSSDEIESYLEDSEGNVWIGTTDGLDRFSKSSFRAASLPEDPRGRFGKSVYPASDGGLLLSHYGPNGYLHIPPGGQTAVLAGNLWLGPSFNFPQPQLVPPVFVPDALVQQGIRGELEVRVKGSRRAEDYPWLKYEPNPPVLKPSYEVPLTDADYRRESFGGDIFARDGNGRIWLAKLHGGLFLVRRGDFRSVVELEGKGVDSVITDSKGDVWVGGTEGLFGLIDGRWRQITPAEGMFAGRVHAFYLGRDGALWILGGGVSRLRDGHFSSFQANLPFREVNSMVEDDDGYVWFTTMTGIFRIAPEEFSKAEKNREYSMQYKRFDESDGLTSLPPGERFNCARTIDGRLWFTLGDSVVWIDPHHIVENRIPPPVLIEGASADGERLRPDSGSQLPPRVRSLRIDYTALSFVVPERVRFRVKLEGFDHGWVDAGTRREAVYTNLEPKHYRFRVKACNNEGVWNEAGAAWDFRVLPAFYQTYWFLALAMAASAWALWILHRVRVRLATQVIRARYEERLAERTRIGRELHDTLLQSITGASLQLNAVSKIIATAPEEAGGILSTVRRQLHASLREARHKVWELRSPAAERGDLAPALRESLESMTKGVAVFRFAVEGEPCRIDPEIEEHVLRIAQESVSNSMRHAQASTIFVKVRFEPEKLLLSVADDGMGFDVESVQPRNGHWGLKNMQDRAKEIHAEWKIVTAPGCGTTIETLVHLAERNGK